MPVINYPWREASYPLGSTIGVATKCEVAKGNEYTATLPYPDDLRRALQTAAFHLRHPRLVHAVRLSRSLLMIRAQSPAAPLLVTVEQLLPQLANLNMLASIPFRGTTMHACNGPESQHLASKCIGGDNFPILPPENLVSFLPLVATSASFVKHLPKGEFLPDYKSGTQDVTPDPGNSPCTPVMHVVFLRDPTSRAGSVGGLVFPSRFSIVAWSQNPRGIYLPGASAFFLVCSSILQPWLTKTSLSRQHSS